MRDNDAPTAAALGPMIRRIRWSSIAVLAASLAIVLLLLTIPIPDARHHRIVNAILNSGHLPLFFTAAMIAFRFAGSGWLVLAGLVVVVVGGEVVQTAFPGRTGDWGDVFHGLAGIALAWLWNPWRTHPWLGLRARFAASLALLAIPVVDIGPELADACVARWQFPILYDDSTPWQEHRWRTHQSRWELRPGAAVLAFETGPDDYSGAELIPIRGDWSGYESLVLELEAARPVELNVSIRDQRAALGYNERFNATVDPFRGVRTVEWPLRDIEQGPRASALDLRRVDSLNLFISVKDAPADLIVRRVWLRSR